jgi:hypothetical protein
VTVPAFKDITANDDVYENRHYLWDTLSNISQDDVCVRFNDLNMKGEVREANDVTLSIITAFQKKLKYVDVTLILVN